MIKLNPYKADEQVFYQGNSYEIKHTNLIMLLLDSKNLMEDLHKSQCEVLEEATNSSSNVTQYNTMLRLYKIYRNEIVFRFNQMKQQEIDVINIEIEDLTKRIEVETDGVEVLKQSLLFEQEKITVINVDQEVFVFNINVCDTEVTEYATRIQALKKERSSLDSNITTDKVFEMC